MLAHALCTMFVFMFVLFFSRPY